MLIGQHRQISTLLEYLETIPDSCCFTLLQITPLSDPLHINSCRPGVNAIKATFLLQLLSAFEHHIRFTKQHPTQGANHERYQLKQKHNKTNAESCIHPDFLKGRRSRTQSSCWRVGRLSDDPTQASTPSPIDSHILQVSSLAHKETSRLYIGNSKNFNISCFLSFRPTDSTLFFSFVFVPQYEVVNTTIRTLSLLSMEIIKRRRRNEAICVGLPYTHEV